MAGWKGGGGVPATEILPTVSRVCPQALPRISNAIPDIPARGRLIGRGGGIATKPRRPRCTKDGCYFPGAGPNSVAGYMFEYKLSSHMLSARARKSGR
jgi:hypothetical protein